MFNKKRTLYKTNAFKKCTIFSLKKTTYFFGAVYNGQKYLLQMFANKTKSPDYERENCGFFLT